MIPAAALVLFVLGVGLALYAVVLTRLRSTTTDAMASVLDSRLVPVFDELDLIYEQVRPREGLSVWEAVARVEAAQAEFRAELIELTEGLDALAEAMAA